MKLRYILFSLCLILLSPAALFAQDRKGGKSHQEMRRQMQEYKMKFLAQEMGLSGEKQSRFFSAYKTYAESRDRSLCKLRKARKSLQSNPNPTDADYESFRQQQNDVRKAENAADTEFRAALEKILTPKEIFLLQEGERKFRDKMQDMKTHKKGRARPKK